MQGLSATFTPAGLLTISGCAQGEARAYTPFPSTRLWGVELKTHERATYQTTVLKRMKARWGRGGMPRRGGGMHG